MKEKKSKFNLRKIIFALLFAVIISTYFVNYYYAKYRSGGSINSSARTAGFSVSGTGGSNSITVDGMTPPYSSDYSFSVTSNSEVAVEYGITVTFAQNIPAWVTVKLDGNTGTQSGDTATFSNAGTFAAGNSTNNHTLTFQADPASVSATTFSSITIRVDAVQTD